MAGISIMFIPSCSMVTRWIPSASVALFQPKRLYSKISDYMRNKKTRLFCLNQKLTEEILSLSWSLSLLLPFVPLHEIDFSFLSLFFFLLLINVVPSSWKGDDKNVFCRHKKEEEEKRKRIDYWESNQ